MREGARQKRRYDPCIDRSWRKKVVLTQLEILERLKAMLAARVSLLKVTKSALTDAVVLETEAHTARDHLVAELKPKMRKRPRQDLYEVNIKN